MKRLLKIVGIVAALGQFQLGFKTLSLVNWII